jgi:hypothetical protein
LATCSSYFLETQFIGFDTIDFFKLLSTSSILGTTSIILSSLAKTPLPKFHTSPAPTLKIAQVSNKPIPNPIKPEMKSIQLSRLCLAFFQASYFSKDLIFSSSDIIFYNFSSTFFGSSKYQPIAKPAAIMANPTKFFTIRLSPSTYPPIGMPTIILTIRPINRPHHLFIFISFYSFLFRICRNIKSKVRKFLLSLSLCC